MPRFIYLTESEKRKTENYFTPKIVNGGENFVRCAVSESGAYFGVCEHLRHKQGAKFTCQNDFIYFFLS